MIVFFFSVRLPPPKRETGGRIWSISVPVVLSAPSRNALATKRCASAGFSFSSAMILLQLLLFLLLHITLPVAVNIRCGVDGVDKAVDQIFFAAQLDAGVNRPVDGSQNALVFAVRLVVLHDEHQNVVNVDLHLPDELDLEGNIIVDVFFVPIRFRAIRLIKIEIHTLVILKIPLREKFMPGKLVKRA